MRLLVVEDDPRLAELIRRALCEEGYAVDVAHSATEALELFEAVEYALVTLDLMLPDTDGLDVLRQIRQHRLRGGTPIVIISARGRVNDRIRGLDLGANDYVVKPFAISELTARIRVQLRSHSTRTQGNTLRYGDIELDLGAATVKVAGRKVELKPKEFAILRYFLYNPEVVLTRTRIADNVWGYDFDAISNIIDVHVSRIRQKLRAVAGKNYLHTVRGVGYMLKDG